MRILFASNETVVKHEEWDYAAEWFFTPEMGCWPVGLPHDVGTRKHMEDESSCAAQQHQVQESLAQELHVGLGHTHPQR